MKCRTTYENKLKTTKEKKKKNHIEVSATIYEKTNTPDKKKNLKTAL